MLAHLKTLAATEEVTEAKLEHMRADQRARNAEADKMAQ